MQYQKEDIRRRILQAGKNEFLKNGYHGAKISDIAVSASVPVGNLYRYYGGKNDLFDAIVSDTYMVIPRYVAGLAAVDYSQDRSLTDTAKVLTKTIIQLLDRCGTEIIILMDKSEGSRYADFGQKIQAQVYKYFDQTVFKCKDKQDEVFCWVISKSFLDMIFDILRKGDRQSYGILIERLLKYIFFEAEKRI